MVVHQPQPARAAKAFGGMLLLALFTLLLSAWQVRASGFFDGFEGYAPGGLDSTYSGGPNEGPNGGTNPWFGAKVRALDASPVAISLNDWTKASELRTGKRRRLA